MIRHTYGQRTACKYCGQDIENHGRKQWIDRGGNRQCCPFIKNGEAVTPKTKHAPIKRDYSA